MATLAQVKSALGITGTYQDATLQVYFDETVDFLKESGVADADISAGIVARGVADLWNYGAGDGKLSSYFMQRAAQLAYKRG